MATPKKSSTAIRALLVILGVVALVVGFLAWFYPDIFFYSLIFIFGITLTILGILRLATAFPKEQPSNTRKINAAIGVGALILGVLVLVFPEFAGITAVVLLSIGFMIWGIGLVAVQGIASEAGMGMKILSIILGIIVIALSVVMIFYPEVGGFTYVFFASLAFMMIGIEAMAVGIAGVPLE